MLRLLRLFGSLFSSLLCAIHIELGDVVLNAHFPRVLLHAETLVISREAVSAATRLCGNLSSHVEHATQRSFWQG